MNRRQREALEILGIETTTYTIDSWPMAWGLDLTVEGESIGVVETHGDTCVHTDLEKYRNKYLVRNDRSEAFGQGEEKGIVAPEVVVACRTQREAVAFLVDRYVNREVTV